LESWEKAMWYHWLWCLCNPSWKQYCWHQEPLKLCSPHSKTKV